MRSPEFARRMVDKVRRRRSTKVQQSTQNPSVEVRRTGPKYLVTHEELYEVSLADLGAMKVGTYDDFAARAQEVAKAHNVRFPRMVLDLDLKEENPYGITKIARQIYQDEWDQFAQEAIRMAKRLPHVHVVDGEKYTTGI